MKLSWTQASVIVATLIGLGTIAAGFGYKLPWTTAALGEDLKASVGQLQKQIDQVSKDDSRNNTSTRIDILITNRTLLQSALAHEKPGSPTYILLSGQIDKINLQLRAMGAQ